MGNREDLLAGARRCLMEKGYSGTTARDIATAAGTSLASIGYHFRSTKALLNAALVDAMEEWGKEIERTLAAGPALGGTPAQRFEATWTRIIESFARLRPLWAIQFELIAQMDRLPELREAFATANRQAKLGLAALFENLDPAADPRKAMAVGAFYQALLGGMAAQWLVDPDEAPSAADLAEALRTIAPGLAAQ
ncbi:TetR/AcrR family transcriptional regulator [Microbispora triticiradicis]|uniref:TetR/AcrR family transcriptional regulator n=3 Tax=Microbispora TaxID=2005 RepID=A0ABY3LYM0_9ACTN|nr:MULTISPECIES: TetR/AcrR family transcriptional regulator [Microbispora]RGA04112.1 TetR/AcrR family transcriptional regulator [Microbispora triticiradicis]TLP66137.1 TetR/AcrR family transcriptional regulator [Microbispora fusca]TYB58457.1 TetR/AcrR family transcriptional regulator [Microbispora tritici]GLW23576.1 TetR family transcriptional regulator [Microbispora amethystogenes]